MDTPLCPSTARFNHIVHFVYRVQEHLLIDLNNAMNVELTASDPGDLLSSINNFNNSSDMTDGLEHVIGQLLPGVSVTMLVWSCTQVVLSGREKVTHLWQENSLSKK